MTLRGTLEHLNAIKLLNDNNYRDYSEIIEKHLNENDDQELKIENLTEELNEIKHGFIEKYLRENLDRQVEYECEHEDSGGNYSQLVAEGNWSDQFKRLNSAYFEATGNYLKEDLCWQDIQYLIVMEPETRYQGTHNLKNVMFDCFPVGEIESQFEYKTVIEAASEYYIFITIDEVKAYLDDTKEFCAHTSSNNDTFELYESTDNVWSATIRIKALKTFEATNTCTD